MRSRDSANPVDFDAPRGAQILKSASRTGAAPVGETPEEFAAFIAAERKRLGGMIGKTGMAPAD